MVFESTGLQLTGAFLFANRSRRVGSHLTDICAVNRRRDLGVAPSGLGSVTDMGQVHEELTDRLEPWTRSKDCSKDDQSLEKDHEGYHFDGELGFISS